jgi:predicted RNA-binding Zn-ribbon protein involved in translation (DUF1610 family)
MKNKKEKLYSVEKVSCPNCFNEGEVEIYLNEKEDKVYWNNFKCKYCGFENEK